MIQRQGNDSKAGLSGFWVIPIMQGSLSLQRTLPKPVIEPPRTRQPLPAPFPENNKCLYLF